MTFRWQKHDIATTMHSQLRKVIQVYNLVTNTIWRTSQPELFKFVLFVCARIRQSYETTNCRLTKCCEIVLDTKSERFHFKVVLKRSCMYDVHTHTVKVVSLPLPNNFEMFKFQHLTVALGDVKCCSVEIPLLFG